MDNDTKLYREPVQIVWPFPAGDSRGWPFKFVNGQQTNQSKALMLDKEAHKLVQFDLSTTEEALL